MFKKLTGIAALCSLLAIANPAAADSNFPNRRMTLVIPFSPGGNSDIYGRILADFLSREFKQQVVVENKPGASGVIAASSVNRAPADGYTIFQSPSSLMVLIPVIEPSDFDVYRDMALVSRLFHQPYFVMVPANSEFKTLNDLVAKAKAAPGTLKFGSIGINTSPHISGELLSDLAGIKLIHVPYKGANDSLTDLIGNRIDFTFGIESSVTAQPEKTRILCILAPIRSKTLAHIPPCGDSVPGLNFAGGMGLQVAKGTPSDVIAKIDAAVRKTMADPAFAEKIASLGITTGEYMSTQVWRDDVAKERELFSRLADRTGLRKKN